MTKLKSFATGVIRSIDTFAAGRIPLRALPSAGPTSPVEDRKAMQKDAQALARDIRRGMARLVKSE